MRSQFAKQKSENRKAFSTHTENLRSFFPCKQRMSELMQLLAQRELGMLPAFALERWDVERRVRNLKLSNKVFAQGSNNKVTTLSIDAAETRYLLTGDMRGSVSVYDLHSPLESGAPPVIPFAPAQQAQRARMQAIQAERPTRITQARSANRLVELATDEFRRAGISSVLWYPLDSGSFVTSSFDGRVHLWDTNLFEPVLNHDIPDAAYCADMSRVMPSTIAVACADKSVYLLDVKSTRRTLTLRAHRGKVKCVRWSPLSEHLLASSAEDKAIFLWDTRRTNGYLFSFDQHNSQQPFSLHAAQSRILKPSNVVSAHSGSVNSLCFTPDGQFLLSSGTDNRVRLWNVSNGLNTLVNFPRTLYRSSLHLQLATTPDGRFLFSPNAKKIGVYDISTGALVNELGGQFGNIDAVAFRAGWNELVSSSDRGLLLWDNTVQHAQHEPSEQDEWSE